MTCQPTRSDCLDLQDITMRITSPKLIRPRNSPQLPELNSIVHQRQLSRKGTHRVESRDGPLWIHSILWQKGIRCLR